MNIYSIPRSYYHKTGKTAKKKFVEMRDNLALRRVRQNRRHTAQARRVKIEYEETSQLARLGGYPTKGQARRRQERGRGPGFFRRFALRGRIFFVSSPLGAKQSLPGRLHSSTEKGARSQGASRLQAGEDGQCFSARRGWAQQTPSLNPADAALSVCGGRGAAAPACLAGAGRGAARPLCAFCGNVRGGGARLACRSTRGRGAVRRGRHFPTGQDGNGRRGYAA